MHAPPSRKRELSLLVCSGVRLKFSRLALPAFRRFFHDPPRYEKDLGAQRKEEWVAGFRERITDYPEIAAKIIEKLLDSDQPFPWQHLERLTHFIDFFLLSPKSLSFLLHPPRGQADILT